MATHVNLDALLARADLVTRGESAGDIPALNVLGLAPKGFLYPALRKPDFQRETSNWSPEQVTDLVSTFVRGDLIPAIILWRSGPHVFVIDGAHRLSAIVAWLHDDYGDGDISRRYFQGQIPPEQIAAAARTRTLIASAVGSYDEYELAREHPKRVREDIAERVTQFAWKAIPVQWIEKADHEKAEKAFFRINQGGTKIDAVERRILLARRSAAAMAARAILRRGTGNAYWEKFTPDVQEKIEELGGEIGRLLFEPSLSLPIKTLDVPMAGPGYGSHILPFLFDLVVLVNEIPVSDSSKKRGGNDDALVEDEDGSQTVKYLNATRATLNRLCSNHPSSLGLHPALYFYSHSGVFQPQALLSFLQFFKGFRSDDFKAFTSVRSSFEEFMMAHRGITEAVRKLGSGGRSRPRVVQLYKRVFDDLRRNLKVRAIVEELSKSQEFGFLFSESVLLTTDDDMPGSSFNRGVKGAAFLRDALPTALKCPTCGGLVHKNGMQTGHSKARREGGKGQLGNAIIQHPFCNSTMAQ